ncbi:hypothetical protein V9L05_19900 [Bernardetia sp. Wsw4-3y2]|uniref:hypothetical protein n=1 Tax=Bernardetia sp. Wsw4-3y2 TaxID=3127471 RepID=UPI0030CB1ACD
MRYYIKSKKSGSVKTLLFFDTSEDFFTQIALKKNMKVVHLIDLFTLINTHILTSENFGKKRIEINEHTYAVLKQTNSPEENEVLANNANLWRKVYERNKGFKYAKDFTTKEKQILKKQNWTPELVQAWFDLSEWYAKTKTISFFDKYISEVQDWLNTQKQGVIEVEKNNYPVFYSVKFKNSLPPQEIPKYLQHLQVLGYKPVYSVNNKSKIVDWVKP